jgi:hypothetical protein
MASINEFIAQVKEEGLARDNRYLVTITPPQFLVANAPDVKLRLLCQSVSMPGMNFVSNPVLTYGEQREVIYNRQFEPINMEWILDSRLDIKKFWDEWQQLMIHPVSRMVSYYEDYIGTIEIDQLDASDEERPRYAVRLYEAYPKTVAPISFSAGSKEITKLSVTIEYKYWLPLNVASGSNDSQYIPDFNMGSPSYQDLLGGGIQSFNVSGSALDWPYQEIDI